MLAAAERNPLNMDQSIVKRLPDTKTTIMVSPIALQKPSITEDKTPEAAVGRMTFTVVCQRVAHKDKEPAVSAEGTPLNASSEIEKTIGKTASPNTMPTTMALRC